LHGLPEHRCELPHGLLSLDDEALRESALGEGEAYPGRQDLGQRPDLRRTERDLARQVIDHEELHHGRAPAQRVAVAVVAARDQAVVDDGERLVAVGGKGRGQELLDEGFPGLFVGRLRHFR